MKSSFECCESNNITSRCCSLGVLSLSLSLVYLSITLDGIALGLMLFWSAMQGYKNTKRCGYTEGRNRHSSLEEWMSGVKKRSRENDLLEPNLCITVHGGDAQTHLPAKQQTIVSKPKTELGVKVGVVLAKSSLTVKLVNYFNSCCAPENQRMEIVLLEMNIR